MEGNKSSLRSEFLDLFEQSIFVNSEGFFDENIVSYEFKSLFPYVTMLRHKAVGTYLIFEINKKRYMAIALGDVVFAGEMKQNSNISKVLYMKEFIKESGL